MPDVFLVIGLGLNLAVMVLLARSQAGGRGRSARRGGSHRMSRKRYQQE
jgi:monoamine oxidase